MLGASSHMPYRTIERLFIAACLVANVIIAGSFQVNAAILFHLEWVLKCKKFPIGISDDVIQYHFILR